MGLFDSVVGALGQTPGAAADGGAGGAGVAGGAGAIGGAPDLMAACVALLGQGGSAGRLAGLAGSAGGLAGLAGSAGGLAGLAGLVAKFQQGGLGDVVDSWVGHGQNLPISPGQLGGVLGQDTVSSLARQLGVDPGTALGQLSQMLPQVVDRLTPDGRVPAGDVGAGLGSGPGAGPGAGLGGGLGDLGGLMGGLLKR